MILFPVGTANVPYQGKVSIGPWNSGASVFERVRICRESLLIPHSQNIYKKSLKKSIKNVILKM